MNQLTVVISSPEKEKALEYLALNLQGSLLLEALGPSVLKTECNRIFLVTASDPPPTQDWASGWGAKATLGEDWLIAEVLQYLQSNANGVVLFEDLVSLPGDPGLGSDKCPPLWVFEKRIFWPVLADGADYATVEKALAWSAAFRKIIGFATLPSRSSPTLETKVLSESVFRPLASSITRLVTDIFDGEGFMVWERRN
jgi:hypothetical protein